MCGLTGFLNQARDQTIDQMTAIVGAMAQSIHYRGPDDTGVWCDPTSGIALGHKRLSIVDLSPAGHQPMKSGCGRYVIAFNGEIYNHNELRKELIRTGHSFRGHSDTEVLVEGFSEWGVSATIPKCYGMFAMSIWDTQGRTLFLVRDRLGKKPLYYGRFGSTLLFGSETKSLRRHPSFQAEIDRVMLDQFLQYSYLPRGSIFRGVTQVDPGQIVTIEPDDAEWWSGTRPPKTENYWRFDEVALKGLRQPFTGSYDEATDGLEQLLLDAVGIRMVADVPLGAFLSGGIDSSLVVALMQRLSDRPVKTFTIGFEEEAYNEAPFAARVASHLKTDHTELYVTSKEARDVIPLLPTMFDEPFADSSQIPTYLVSRLARQHVTVSLSGDGGDELFCGYRRYFEALKAGASGTGSQARVARWLCSLPLPIRRTMTSVCRGLSGISPGQLSALLTKVANVLGDLNSDARYLRNFRHWSDGNVVLGLDARHRSTNGTDWAMSMLEKSCLKQFGTSHASADPQQIWQWFDTHVYLPADILTKVDRASMAVSLESRVPLLDHRVVEYAWTLPHSFKVNPQGDDRSQSQGQGKTILRTLLSRSVPTELFERPKVGFGVPIDSWLRGPLRDWAENLLDGTRLSREGFLNPIPIRKRWEEHISGHTNWHYHLWDILIFQSWLESLEE